MSSLARALVVTVAVGVAAGSSPSWAAAAPAAPAGAVRATDLPGTGWRQTADTVADGFPARLQSCLRTRALERRMHYAAGPAWSRETAGDSQLVMSRSAALPAHAPGAYRSLAYAYRTRLTGCVRSVLLPWFADQGSSFDAASATVRSVPMPRGDGYSAAAAQLRLPLAGNYGGTLVVQVVFVTSPVRATGVAVVGSPSLSTAALRRLAGRLGARSTAVES